VPKLGDVPVLGGRFSEQNKENAARVNGPGVVTVKITDDDSLALKRDGTVVVWDAQLGKTVGGNAKELQPAAAKTGGTGLDTDGDRTARSKDLVNYVAAYGRTSEAKGLEVTTGTAKSTSENTYYYLAKDKLEKKVAGPAVGLHLLETPAAQEAGLGRLTDDREAKQVAADLESMKDTLKVEIQAAPERMEAEGKSGRVEEEARRLRVKAEAAKAEAESRVKRESKQAGKLKVDFAEMDPNGQIVPSGLTNVVAIAAGNYHSLALRANGTVTAWGAKAEEQKKPAPAPDDAAHKKPSPPPPIPQPEVTTRENRWSTFSLNVSDVSFKLAGASLESGALPEPGSIRVEEFINAFHYRDPAPAPGARLAFAWERARYPFAHNRDLLRLAIQTAARGREAQRPLNLVILLDNSGSMERPDRVQILREALQVLARQLRPQDRISVVAFARTARLWVDGMAGGKPAELLARVLDLNPQGGTNLEDALGLAYATARKHFLAQGVNRVILLTDGAANLGNVEPEALKQQVVAQRQRGIALDCFGVGWEGYNDDLLEVLSRNGDGRYGFLNEPEAAGPEFADQLAGALNVAAADVKTQVEFNPRRVVAWRQVGYAKHQLTKEQFRDNTVDAAEIAAAEAGNALYVIAVNPQGEGPLGVVRVRYKVPSSGEYVEQEWSLPYQEGVGGLERAGVAMRLAAVGAAFGEWLGRHPYAGEVKLGALQGYLAGVPEAYAPDPRPARLAWMLRQAVALAGK
jgi:secreted protein with Ig-like and vWFA domain